MTFQWYGSFAPARISQYKKEPSFSSPRRIHSSSFTWKHQHIKYPHLPTLPTPWIGPGWGLLIFFKLARQVWCEFSECVCEISVENKGSKRNLLVPSRSLSLTTRRPRPGFHVTAKHTNLAHLRTMLRDTTLLIPEWNPDDLEIRPQVTHE